MTKYKLKYEAKILRQLRKLDPSVQKLIKAWIEKNLLDTSEPRIQGQALRGSLDGYWRYRIGDYRMIVEIEDDNLLIIAISIAHRREVYRG
ncbi:MAG: type II toxin-antitoxin system RelE/ParE family toxin [Tissierellia bacterium]|nr:type II toxin-antitoxin system RelE/ParE family toxin [Tissierellia bacterium]